MRVDQSTCWIWLTNSAVDGCFPLRKFYFYHQDSGSQESLIPMALLVAEPTAVRRSRLRTYGANTANKKKHKKRNKQITTTTKLFFGSSRTGMPCKGLQVKPDSDPITWCNKPHLEVTLKQVDGVMLYMPPLTVTWQLPEPIYCKGHP